MYWISSHFYKDSDSSDTAHPQSGFGLIELMVSISIMIIVVSIVLVRQGSFNSAVLLRSQAYEIALSLRETQLSAVSATNIGSDFSSLLGIHFDRSSLVYRTFEDTSVPADGYNAGEEIGQQGLVDSRFEIENIRYQDPGGASWTAVESVSIVFERPNFDARFFGPASQLQTTNAVRVDLMPRGGGISRSVVVTKTGQISVETF